jgi:glucosamine--fructose-6-phosphate aminotransferase (isomerizing)
MADVVVDVMAGPEVAVPASKSVTSMIAILLWAASILGGGGKRTASSLHETADDVGTWLAGPDVALVNSAASALAHDRGVIVVGAGYGGPVANEIALKIKEASYVHAEGFPAGEFRHGSSAMLDASTAIVAIVDEASRDIVVRPLDEAARTGAERFVIGASVGDVPRLGPITGESFNTLGWLVTGQLLALALGRARGVESDAPRGLSKAIV